MKSKAKMVRQLLLAATILAAAAAAASSAVTSVDSTTPPPPTTTTPAPPPPTSPTVYEMLAQYNFPVGVLPEGVQSYVLQPDGSFEVRLPGDCEFREMKKYTIHYSSRVAGGIRPGSIGGLEGVKVKVLFFWLRVTGVDRDGDQLRFQVGGMTKSFPVDALRESPRCG